MSVPSLKFKSAFEVNKNGIDATGQVPHELEDYLDDLDYEERMGLINQVRPAHFTGHKQENNRYVIDESTCGDECIIETGDCRKNILVAPQAAASAPSRVLEFVFPSDLASAWILDLRFVKFQSEFVTIWDLGIEKIVIRFCRDITLTIPGTCLKALAYIFKLQPEQIPVFLKSNPECNVLFTDAILSQRRIKVYFKEDVCESSLSLLVTFSHHYNYYPPGNVYSMFEADMLQLSKTGSTTGVQKLFIKNEDFPQNRVIKIRDLNMDGHPFEIKIPKSKMKVIGDVTVVDVQELTFEVLLDNVWYLHRNVYLSGSGHSWFRFLSPSDIEMHASY